MIKEQRTVEKPWGKEIIWAECDHYAGKILIIEKNNRLSLQYHEKKTETIMVLSGVLFVETGDPENVITLTPGQSFHVSPGTKHRFCARDVDVSLVEVSTPELNDVVRIEDDYKR